MEEVDDRSEYDDTGLEEATDRHWHHKVRVKREMSVARRAVTGPRVGLDDIP